MGELLNVCKHIQTNLGQNLLAGFLQNHCLQIGADQRNHQNARVQADPDVQLLQPELSLDQALNVTDDQRGYQIVDNGEDHDKKHQHEALPVGLRVGKEPPDDLRVGHMPLVVIALFPVPAHGKVGQHKHNGEGTDDGAHDQNWEVIVHKLKHSARLLPLPAAADPPFCGIRRRCRKALHAGPPLPPRRHQ